MIVDYTCQWCGLDHPIFERGCPHIGRATMPRPRPEKVTEAEKSRMARLAERVRADMATRKEHEAAVAAAVAREWRVGKVRVVLREVLEEADAARQREGAAVRAELDDVLDGRRWVDGWETRQAHTRETTVVDRLRARFDRRE